MQADLLRLVLEKMGEAEDEAGEEADRWLKLEAIKAGFKHQIARSRRSVDAHYYAVFTSRWRNSYIYTYANGKWSEVERFAGSFREALARANMSF